MGEKSWRPITFKDGHSLETEGQFKGGGCTMQLTSIVTVLG